MKKIMFYDYCHLTEAVLNGSKTQTRRLVGNSAMYSNRTDRKDSIDMSKAPYKVGEIIAIAQPYEDIYKEMIQRGAENFAARIRATFHDSVAWRNKMFVEAAKMSHHIKVVAIRVERLQDISDSDCMNEGIRKGEFMNTWDTFYYEVGETYNAITAPTAKDAYSKLIDKTCDKDTWAANPYVWVYDFVLVD
jgi:hypothetical protein